MDGWYQSLNRLHSTALLVFFCTTHHHQHHRAKVHKQRGTEAGLNRRWQSKQMRGINGAAVFYFAKYPFSYRRQKNNKATQLVKHSFKKKKRLFLSFPLSHWANYKWSVKRDREKNRVGTCKGRSGEVTPSASESSCCGGRGSWRVTNGRWARGGYIKKKKQLTGNLDSDNHSNCQWLIFC